MTSIKIATLQNNLELKYNNKCDNFLGGHILI